MVGKILARSYENKSLRCCLEQGTLSEDSCILRYPAPVPPVVWGPQVQHLVGVVVGVGVPQKPVTGGVAMFRSVPTNLATTLYLKAFIIFVPGNPRRERWRPGDQS